MARFPLVTVVIIFYNEDRFLDEAVQSVLGQKYDAWELLLVDDGSTDSSAEIAREYAREDERIRYLQHPHGDNRGMSATRNLGLRHSRGKYITFLDADDILLSEALHEQTEVLDAHPSAAMVYGPIQWWYGWTGGPNDESKDFVESILVPPNTLYKPRQLVPLLLNNEIAIPSGMLLRRDAVEGIGGFEPSFPDLFEDQVFCLKLCLHYAVYATDRCWYKYRQHPDSCCSTAIRTSSFQFDKPNAPHQFFLEWAKNYLQQHDVEDQGIWRAVATAGWPYNYPALYAITERIQGLLTIAKDHLPFQSAVKDYVKQLLRAVLPHPVYIQIWKLWQRNGRSMQTLTIIAHHQPITKSSIAALQSTDPTPMLKTLEGLNLVRSGGEMTASDSAPVYRTTECFHEHFGPKMPTIRPIPSKLAFDGKHADGPPQSGH